MSSSHVTVVLDKKQIADLILTINRILSDREVLERAEEVLIKALLAR